MSRRSSKRLLPFLLAAAAATNAGHAATCGDGPQGFGAWKQAFAQEARAKAIGTKGIAALMGASYSEATIRADRSQHSFKLSLDAFIAKRGGAAIVSRGRALKAANAALFASIENRFGVPPGPLIAI
jgi:membrane-bound lytic murein transglycosylase B